MSTIRELTEVTKPLVNPAEAAARLKQTLHSVFEVGVSSSTSKRSRSRTSARRPSNCRSYNGTTPFVVAYVTQMALGGHSIPVNRGLLITHARGRRDLRRRVRKGAVPGLERAVSKNKGVEVGSLLHQLGVEVGRNPYGPNARKLLLEIDPNCKDRLPKRKPSRTARTAAKAAQPAEAKGKAGAAKDAKKKAGRKAGPAPPPARKKPRRPARRSRPPSDRSHEAPDQGRHQDTDQEEGDNHQTHQAKTTIRSRSRSQESAK